MTDGFSTIFIRGVRERFIKLDIRGGHFRIVTCCQYEEMIEKYIIVLSRLIIICPRYDNKSSYTMTFFRMTTIKNSIPKSQTKII